MSTSPVRNGPHPGIVGVIAFALVVLGLVVTGLLSGGDALSSPDASARTLAARVAAHPEAWRVSGFFQLGTAVPIAVYAAVMHAHLTRLRVRVPGPTIGLVGGVLASTSLAVSGVTTWVQGQPEIAGSAVLVRALAYVALGLGGFGFVMGIGLLVAGAAVPGLMLGLLPRPLAWVGLAIAVLAELSWFGMLAGPMTYLLPVGRFAGLMWLVVAGFTVRRTHRGAEREETTT